MTNIRITFLTAAVFLFIGASAAFAGEVCTAPVQTAQGPVTGMAVKGEASCAYLGIPYAAPPVGELRWRAPQPPAERTTSLNATSFGDSCLQHMPKEPKEPQRGEDCLYLNIWTPKKAGKYPVMFWIHGGAYLMGDGAQSVYWGDRLAPEKDVVIVTINYRLNVFGFLSLPELAKEDPNGSSGNYGFLDQVAALKWVHENIAGFGGDPDNITVFGQSAGGWSVCNVMASPLTAGLFAKAILESGGCDVSRTREESYGEGRTFAKESGCSGDDRLACMRNLPAGQIQKASGGIPQIVGSVISMTSVPKFIWSPVIDGAAFKETPIETLRSGNYNKVPFMVGSTKEEVKLFMAFVPGFRKYSVRMLKYFVTSSLGEEAWNSITRLYPFDEYSVPADAVTDAFSDAGLSCKCFDAAEAASNYEPKVYYYRYDYRDHRGPDLFGAAHATELPLVFDSLDRSLGMLLFTKAQAKRAKPLSEIIMSYWTNFAKTGDPNGPGLLQWPPYNEQTRQRMILDLPPRVITADNVEKCEFWRTQDVQLH